jgi:formylglycine-generating enzyme required for sulfatase activity
MRSLALAVAVGAAAGGIALAARYLPLSIPGERGARDGDAHATPSGAPTVAPTASARTAARVADKSVAAAAREEGPLGLSARRRPIPIPRSEQFASDPALTAACPESMALVEGSFCPEVQYACLRPSDELGYRCAEYARGQRCHRRRDPRRFCIDRYEWPNRPGDNPRVFVDWHEAKKLCAADGKRLCRRSEWILACEGPKRLPYPWGFVRQPSPCNIDRAAIPFDLPAMMDERTRDLELARLWQADRIGTHPDCVSSFGAYDMSGNVDEWTDNAADNARTKYPSTLNGGYWGPVRDTCRLTTRKHGPSFRFYQVGFRCCADPIDGVAWPAPKPFVEDEEQDEGGEAAGEVYE